MKHVENDIYRVRERERKFDAVEKELSKFINLHRILGTEDFRNELCWFNLQEISLRIAKKILSPECLKTFKASKVWILNVIRRNSREFAKGCDSLEAKTALQAREMLTSFKEEYDIPPFEPRFKRQRVEEKIDTNPATTNPVQADNESTSV